MANPTTTGYSVQLSNGDILANASPDGPEIKDVSQVANSIADTSKAPIALIRRGARHYTDVLSEQLVHITENFADNTAPANPLTGMLWYDTSAQVLKVRMPNEWQDLTAADNSDPEKLATPRQIALTGDATGSTMFDGSANVNIAVTLANVPGLVPGTYSAPTIVVDAKGRITSATNASSPGAGSIAATLGYVPADDAAVVKKVGSTMTGPLVMQNTDINVTGTGRVRQDGNVLVPPGVIVMWSGASPPAGWALCNGSNGTPDLRGRFIVGSGGSISGTGGTTGATVTTSSGGDHTHNFSTGAAGAHSHGGSTGAVSLGIEHMPPHNHATSWGESQLSYAKYGVAGANNNYGSKSTDTDNYEFMTSSVGGGQAHAHSIAAEGNHTHSISGGSAGSHTHTVSVNTLPPYYTLAYIMKL